MTAPASEARFITGVTGQNRIVLFGLFGIGNLGNESTLWVTLHHLRMRLPEAEVLCVSDALPDFARGYGVAPFPFDPLPLRGRHRLPTLALANCYSALATLLMEPIRKRLAAAMLAKTDRFIVVGTGALDDLGEPPWGMPARLLRWCNAAREAGANVQLLAVGAGPILSSINRLLMRRAVAMSDLRAYRDTYSREYMADLGVSSPTDEVVPDLVFALPDEWRPPWRPATSPPKVVGVGVMAYFGWNTDRDEGRQIYSSYIDKMARFVRWLLEAGHHVRLLIGERRTDSQTVADLVKALGPAIVSGAGERLAAPDIASIQDLLREIMRTDIVVATRFHNLVCGLVLGRPVISVGYSAKFEALMKEMRLDEYCQRFESLDVDKLQQQMRQLSARHSMAVKMIMTKTAEYRQQLERLFDATFGPAPAGAETANLRHPATLADQM